MQCPPGTFLAHRGKSAVQKPAGLSTLSKGCILLMVRFARRPHRNLFAVENGSRLSVHLAQGRGLFCPGTCDLQMVTDTEFSQVQRYDIDHVVMQDSCNYNGILLVIMTGALL